MRTNLSVLGVRDFSIESIHSIIPSIDENELYEGVMFKNKDELKTTLGKYALKQKFENQITRSSQTRFLTCKDKLARLNYMLVWFKKVVIGRLNYMLVF